MKYLILKILKFIASWIFTPFFIPVLLVAYVFGIIFWVIFNDENFDDIWKLRPGQNYFKWLMMKDV